MNSQKLHWTSFSPGLQHLSNRASRLHERAFWTPAWLRRTPLRSSTSGSRGTLYLSLSVHGTQGQSQNHASRLHHSAIQRQDADFSAWFLLQNFTFLCSSSTSHEIALYANLVSRLHGSPSQASFISRPYAHRAHPYSHEAVETPPMHLFRVLVPKCDLFTKPCILPPNMTYFRNSFQFLPSIVFVHPRPCFFPLAFYIADHKYYLISI